MRAPPSVSRLPVSTLPSSRAVPARDNRGGIAAMLTAMALFTGNDAFLKLATAGLPPGQIIATRGFFGTLIALGLVLATGQAHRLRDLKSPAVAGRALVEGVVSFTFVAALARLPLANVTAILQSTPLVLTALAVALGLERVGWRRFAAILVGFAGVLLIVRPSPEGFDRFAGLAFLSAALVAVRELITRSIAGHIPTVVVTLGTTGTVMAVGCALALVEAWRPLSEREVAFLAAAALFVTLGNLAIIKAYRIGELAVVSPFRYAVIPTSLAVGYAVFGELPDPISVAGIALIAASGLYTIRREQVRRRQAADRAAPPLAGPRP